MKRLLNITIYFLIFVCILFSCNKTKKEGTEKKYIKSKESLVNINKYLIKKDQEAIENYIKRHKWKMELTETGLWYMIYRKGNGKKAENGKFATISYEISLLDGSICYSSDSLSSKTFLIGQGGVESGLEEGILLMREGDRAKLILPPHLAHGLLGDEDKIPPRSTIIYDIDLLKISDSL